MACSMPSLDVTFSAICLAPWVAIVLNPSFEAICPSLPMPVFAAPFRPWPAIALPAVANNGAKKGILRISGVGSGDARVALPKEEEFDKISDTPETATISTRKSKGNQHTAMWA